ncbi:hypothetical protein FRC0126_02278 [Corynebacterium diphtheriae]|nr:hypothetical protein CIP107560_01910 [Corynebacterium diphtheriae]CAB0670860.1 hypothetical protein CIP107576_02343 [Corynebacterium diphtheriae]CAB0763147.1 hypothetical protein FRC0126_02278 [Corynebacterium diphtheriae]
MGLFDATQGGLEHFCNTGVDEGVNTCESVSGVVDVDVLFWFSGVVEMKAEVGDGFA